MWLRRTSKAVAVDTLTVVLLSAIYLDCSNDNLLDKKVIRDDNMSNLNNEHYWGCECWLALMAFALATWIVMGSEWSGVVNWGSTKMKDTMKKVLMEKL